MVRAHVSSCDRLPAPGRASAYRGWRVGRGTGLPVAGGTVVWGGRLWGRGGWWGPGAAACRGTGGGPCLRRFPGFRARFARQERLAQPAEAAPQDPRDLHLGDADGLRDLPLGLLPVEAQMEDPAVTLRQPPHQGRQGHGVDDQAERRVLGAERAGRGVPAAACGRVEGPRAAFVHRAQRGQHTVRPEPGVLGDLLGGGRVAVEPLLELLDGPEDLSGGLLQRAGQPHGGRTVTKVPPDFTGDLGKRVGQEGVAPPGVVAVDGLDQPQGRHLDEIVPLLAVAPEAARDAVGHRQQPADDVVPEGGPPRSRGLLGELAQQRVEVLRGRLGRGGVTRPDHVGG